MWWVVLMSLKGDLDSLKLMRNNMKNHLDRKMKVDDDHAHNYDDTHLIRFLETCFGFDKNFIKMVVEEWRDEQ